MTEIPNPIRMEFLSAKPGAGNNPVRITNLNSYSFDRSVLTPASAFRFTAGSVDKELRMQIRSGDTVKLYIDATDTKSVPVGVGFVDETDCHGSAHALEYVITGRDTVGQLVDNDCVDVYNKIIAFEQAAIDTVMAQLLANTRLSKTWRTSQLDRKLTLALATSPGETKLNCLQRYLEPLNGLVWADVDGTLLVDKPNFTKSPSGTLSAMYSKPNTTNVVEFRVKRNVNQAIRQIVTQLNGTEYSPALVRAETLTNMDATVRSYAGTNVGRSVSRTFSYSQGTDAINQGKQLGVLSYQTHTLGRGYSAREVARENMRILDIEAVVDGHLNENGDLYNVDQIYTVILEDEDVAEPMYVYAVTYEMTPDHGMMTHLRLCRPWTIVAYADALDRVVSK